MNVLILCAAILCSTLVFTYAQQEVNLHFGLLLQKQVIYACVGEHNLSISLQIWRKTPLSPQNRNRYNLLDSGRYLRYVHMTTDFRLNLVVTQNNRRKRNILVKLPNQKMICFCGVAQSENSDPICVCLSEWPQCWWIKCSRHATNFTKNNRQNII
jgi:hypothetical protein